MREPFSFSDMLWTLAQRTRALALKAKAESGNLSSNISEEGGIALNELLVAGLVMREPFSFSDMLWTLAQRTRALALKAKAGKRKPLIEYSGIRWNSP